MVPKIFTLLLLVVGTYFLELELVIVLRKLLNFLLTLDLTQMTEFSVFLQLLPIMINVPFTLNFISFWVRTKHFLRVYCVYRSVIFLNER